MRRWLWVVVFVGLGLLTTTWAVLANDNKEQRKLVYDYLTAYARNDNPKIRPFLTTRDANQFGPWPFTETPTLKRAKVDDNQAIVEFTAKVGDDKFPAKGGLLCKQHEGRWLVRQVLFYESVPAIFNLPKKSVTDEDRQEESSVTLAATTFLRAWQRGDTDVMLRNWHRWMDRESDPIKGLSVSNFDCSFATTKWNEAFVKYKAKLTYKWGILSYTMNFNGGLMMVKEDGAWRMRGNVMVMYFD